MNPEEKKECLAALDAIMEGYPASFSDGFITVKNPDGDAEGIALRGVNPNLVIDLQQLKSVVEKSQ